MNVTWVVERDFAPTALVTKILVHGHKVRYIDNLSDVYRLDLPPSPIICYGSINVVALLSKAYPYSICCDFPSYRFSHYAQYIGLELLNSDFVLVPGYRIVDYVQKNGPLFVKSDSGMKLVTGQVSTCSV